MKLTFRNLVTIQFLFSMIIFVVLSREWVAATYIEPGFPQVDLSLSANQLDPTLNGLAIAAIASTLGVIATRGWARKFVGAIIFLIGIGILFATNSLIQNLENLVGSELAQAVGRDVTGWTSQTSIYAWVIFPAAVIILCCGALIATKSFDSQLSARYQRERSSANDLTPWQALDQGIDPTLADPTNQ
jgi:uncharacterized membrane protein (TIGR02234 family)